MSDPERDTTDLSTSDSKSLQETIARSRRAWQEGKSPEIEQFLPTDETKWQTAQVELIQADLDLWPQAGEEARIQG